MINLLRIGVVETSSINIILVVCDVSIESGVLKDEIICALNDSGFDVDDIGKVNITFCQDCQVKGYAVCYDDSCSVTVNKNTFRCSTLEDDIFTMIVQALAFIKIS